MLSHEEMIRLQAEEHDWTDADDFRSNEEYVLHLMHKFAYVQASRLAENKTVLDLGCNTGYGSEILSGCAKKVVGVDVSGKAISTAKTQYGRLPIDFRLIDGKQLPFEANEFDMIVSCQVIEHIVDHSVYINELKRVLSPRGIVLFTTPNAPLRLDPGMKPWNRFHVREFDHSSFYSLLSSFFSTVRIVGLFAREPLYSIERNRVNREREIARKRGQRGTIPYFQNVLRSLIKKVLPNLIVVRIRNLLRSASRIRPVVDESLVNEHGIEDFSYRSEDLDIALDLLAICADDETVLENIWDKLSLY